MSTFITFEGGEGSGKSTQAMLLYDYLKRQGYDALLTREPGGTDVAELLRNIVVKGNTRLNKYTELLIFMAARIDHWENCIKPALDNGKIVICDRFQMSTLVYQCVCGGCDVQLANDIYDKSIGYVQPDYTFVIDVDPKIGIMRSINRLDNTDLRFEQKDISFHQKVRDGYLSLACNYKCKIINGALSIYEIHEQILHEVKKFLHL